MDFGFGPEDRLVEAEYWFAIGEMLAKEHLEAGREIDRQIARLQQMRSEDREGPKKLRVAPFAMKPTATETQVELWGFVHWVRWIRQSGNGGK